MSEGPIKRERAGHVVAFASTADAHRVCMAAGEDRPGRGYCGRKATGAKVTSDWAEVVCTDCEACWRADEAAGA